MAIDTKHEELQGLRIDRSERGGEGEPSRWAKRIIIVGISVVVLLGLSVLAYRVFASGGIEVETARATVESTGDPTAGIVLTATGYIVAHHKIEANSKVTGRVAWIGVEKGDHVKEGQVLVRLEDQEFRAQYQQAEGAAESARAQLVELQHGSRPEEIQQTEHNLSEAKATAANDKITLDRTSNLFAQGVMSQQALDDAKAKYEASQQRAHSLEQSYQLAKLGPRAEEISRAKGAVMQAEGQAAYAKSQLDATVIRAPITGTILDRSVEKGELLTGQFASAARPVFSLADLKDLQVELDIAQDDFARLGPKQKGIITVDAFPDRKYNGVIAEISPEANRQKATVQLKVQVLDPDEYLRPEMNSTVKFIADEPSKKSTVSGPAGVFVPTNAVRDHAGKKVVFIAFKDKALRRDVRVLAQRSGGFLVEGLNGGEDVITAGPADLNDGDKIKIKGQS
ncbi:MAG TPA: efflux RND transporter periplasmic adaptor subunit [Candidatus Sulfotelmatobacter sp.]|jgi:HlyD family secretion protein|nr:efflux RND transporter periplasmic adaptor subunit [Candidatus Sulfotelmatobacter sp.]